MRWLGLFIAVVLLCSCGERRVGRYVYVDVTGCVHADKDCISRMEGSDVNTQKVKLAGVAYVDTAEFWNPRYDKCDFCTRCVNDEIYTQLRKIRENGVNPDVFRREIYDYLVREGYDMEPYADFEVALMNRSRNRNLYVELYKDEFVTCSYKDFLRLIGDE